MSDDSSNRPPVPGSPYDRLVQMGVSRRDFMKFCASMAAVLALPGSFAAKIAEAVETAQRPPLVWLEFQDCCGNTEALLRSTKPTVRELVLDVLSVNYHETIMAPAGKQAEKSLEDTVKNQKGKYIAVVEGSIPLGANGVYCCVGGRSAIDIAKEVCGNAMATIAAGTCATYGGIPAAAPNPTGAVSVQNAMPNIKVINLSGCPLNPENLTATVVHFLTFGSLPAVDRFGRPLFAYGQRIHDNCQRRAHFDAGQFVRSWDDEGAKLGWCLYEMGCKGPNTFLNCPVVRYNKGTSWPVQGGHGCVGCSEPAFWDTMTPFYRRLPQVPGFGVETTADKIGIGVAAAAAAGVVAHRIARAVKGTDKEGSEEEKK